MSKSEHCKNYISVNQTMLKLIRKSFYRNNSKEFLNQEYHFWENDFLESRAKILEKFFLIFVWNFFFLDIFNLYFTEKKKMKKWLQLHLESCILVWKRILLSGLSVKGTKFKFLSHVFFLLNSYNKTNLFVWFWIFYFYFIPL